MTDTVRGADVLAATLQAAGVRRLFVLSGNQIMSVFDAVIDTGKHYGFIEKGVIYSKLKTELSTLYVLDDGTIEMKTWTEADDALLPHPRALCPHRRVKMALDGIDEITRLDFPALTALEDGVINKMHAALDRYGDHQAVF